MIHKYVDLDKFKEINIFDFSNILDENSESEIKEIWELETVKEDKVSSNSGTVKEYKVSSNSGTVKEDTSIKSLKTNFLDKSVNNNNIIQSKCFKNKKLVNYDSNQIKKEDKKPNLIFSKKAFLKDHHVSDVCSKNNLILNNANPSNVSPSNVSPSVDVSKLGNSQQVPKMENFNPSQILDKIKRMISTEVHKSNKKNIYNDILSIINEITPYLSALFLIINVPIIIFSFLLFIKEIIDFPTFVFTFIFMISLGTIIVLGIFYEIDKHL